MSEPSSPREDPKHQKQYEKDKETVKKYAKEFTKFFEYDTKNKKNLKVIYSSTLHGFDKKKLYETIINKSNIMFYFETLDGNIFGSYTSKEIPEISHHGSVIITDDPHFFIFCINGSDQRYKSFSLSLFDNKEKKVEYIQNQSKTFLGGVMDMSVGLVTGIVDGATTVVTTAVETAVEGVATGVNALSGTELIDKEKMKKEKKKMRSLCLSSEVNDDWIVETFCGFIVTGNTVMFNKYLGSFYKIEVPPEGFDVNDSNKNVEFMANARNYFVGKGQPKPVELKRMIVIEWSFDKK